GRRDGAGDEGRRGRAGSGEHHHVRRPSHAAGAVMAPRVQRAFGGRLLYGRSQSRFLASALLPLFLLIAASISARDHSFRLIGKETAFGKWPFATSSAKHGLVIPQYFAACSADRSAGQSGSPMMSSIVAVTKFP